LTLALSWCPVKLSKTYFRNFYMFAEKYWLNFAENFICGIVYIFADFSFLQTFP
jgi:hypothetical protein